MIVSCCQRFILLTLIWTIIELPHRSNYRRMLLIERSSVKPCKCMLPLLAKRCWSRASMVLRPKSLVFWTNSGTSDKYEPFGMVKNPAICGTTCPCYSIRSSLAVAYNDESKCLTVRARYTSLSNQSTVNISWYAILSLFLIAYLEARHAGLYIHGLVVWSYKPKYQLRPNLSLQNIVYDKPG